jgi:hypothetical protein
MSKRPDSPVVVGHKVSGMALVIILVAFEKKSAYDQQ